MLMSKPEFARWLRQRIEARTPAAAVRFGDAEARMLEADPGDARSMDEAIEKLKLETGLSLAPEAVLEIKRHVSLAFDEADVLGILYGERAPDGRRMWMGRLNALYEERVASGRPAVARAHCLFSHDIVDSLPEMLAGRRVSVISCRDVKPVLESDWGLADVAVYQVPSQHLTRDVDGDYEATMHDVAIWPDCHSHVRSELTVRERGEVFLVGAGLFGCDLCITARDQGGIAIDMGSALDRIAGKVTRGPKRRVRNLHASGMPVEEIVSHLQRRFRLSTDPDTTARVTKQVREVIGVWEETPELR